MRPSFDSLALGRLRRILESHVSAELHDDSLRRAAVLVPLVETPRGWSLIFLRRSENLSVHSGQIAFPGGSLDPGESSLDAAVREAEEEIGIARQTVELIGRLDDMVTITGYLVTPCIGIVPPDIRYVLQEEEVVEVFDVPIDHLLAPENPDVRFVEYRGRRYPSYFYSHEGVEIWGLTGRMVKGFLDLVHLAL